VLERARAWAVDRFGLRTLHRTFLERRVPRSPWYFGDGAALLTLLMFLVGTGVGMAFTYTPAPGEAYRSVRFITEEQSFGRFVRALHYWSAGAMVFMLVFHLLRQILMAGYKSPREGTWLVGVSLFFAVLLMSFTGYLLRWDERAIHAARVSLSMMQHVPWIGEELVLLAQGGEEPGSLLLSRVYATHAILLPGILLGLVAWHLYLVGLHGTTSGIERRVEVHGAEHQRELYAAETRTQRHGEDFWPETMARSGGLGMGIVGIVFLAAWLRGPAALDPEANLVEPAFPVEEWWFWWYSALIALLPPWLAPTFVWAFPLAVLVALVALPLVDRTPRRGFRARPLAASLVAFTATALVALSAARVRSPWTGWPSGPPPVPEGVELTPGAEQGRQLFAGFGCTSCHPVAGVGQRVAVDIARPRRRLSREEYRAFVLEPPPDIPMPAYAGRIDEARMELLLDFLHAAQAFPYKD
jgi:ubiquinol-cytochrome c reductase cytochrome b subunit